MSMVINRAALGAFAVVGLVAGGSAACGRQRPPADSRATATHDVNLPSTPGAVTETENNVASAPAQVQPQAPAPAAASAPATHEPVAAAPVRHEVPRSAAGRQPSPRATAQRSQRTEASNSARP